MEVKMLAYQKMPSRLEIYERLCKKIPVRIPLISNFVLTMAEETERILLEITKPPEEKLLLPIVLKTNVMNGRVVLENYKCTRCSHLQIRFSFNYCPSCGVPILWDNQSVAVRIRSKTQNYASTGR